MHDASCAVALRRECVERIERVEASVYSGLRSPTSVGTCVRRSWNDAMPGPTVRLLQTDSPLAKLCLCTYTLILPLATRLNTMSLLDGIIIKVGQVGRAAD